jgi:acyl-CoA thioesterase II
MIANAGLDPATDPVCNDVGARNGLAVRGESMTSAVQELVDLLNIEPLELNLFRGRSPQSRWQRVFGGQVIGQALVAACRTVEDVATRPPHSLHAYFLLGGDPKVPIIYEVDRIRDGKSFTTRNVIAIQHGHAIFSMSVSFQVAEQGLSHQFEMPDVAKPEALPSEAEMKERVWPMMPEPVRRSGSAPPAGCPTSRRSINACSPMRPT